MTRLSLQTLVERLGRLGPGDITLPKVEAIVADGVLDEATLRPYVGERADKYARRLVHRSRWFDVMVLTWAPGQFTPVHNHAGNCGWVRLVRGQIAEETFRLVPGSSLPDAGTAADPGERGGCVGLERTGSGVIADVGAVATADRVRAIHRLGNPAAAGGATTVTLHVYSLPHDSCLAFDLERRTCQRRDLAFDPLPA
ncbi:MAG: cysteine dioxygenase family protein [Planctomycetes bacterium]|nr:cysteine dioxygenase family protein [Planctomycetota bacterium]